MKRRPVLKLSPAARKAVLADARHYLLTGQPRPLTEAEKAERARRFAERCALYHATRHL